MKRIKETIQACLKAEETEGHGHTELVGVQLFAHYFFGLSRSSM